MWVVGREKLQDFTEKHTDAEDWIENWLADAENATWQTSRDIKGTYASASFLGANTVIFNVKGNHYRLEVTVAYKTGIVVVLWAGTHAEYDQRNARRR